MIAPDLHTESAESVKERLLPGAWVEVADDGWWDGRWGCVICPWCGAAAGEGHLYTDADQIAVVACPECGRESAIIREPGVKTIAQRLMSPADHAYLRWRADQGRPTTWSEVTP